jgi:hypothetical protein
LTEREEIEALKRAVEALTVRIEYFERLERLMLELDRDSISRRASLRAMTTISLGEPFRTRNGNGG